MKKALVLCLGLGLTTTAVAQVKLKNGKREIVKIHVDGGYAPKSYTGKDGKAAGYYVELLREASNRMKKFELELIPVPWKRGKKIMEDGKGFGLTPAFYHGHDWPYLYPYSIKYEDENVYAYCKKGILASRKNWPKDFTGLRVGNIAGFDGWGGEEFRELVKQKKFKYSESKTSETNVMKLAKDRLDCILMASKSYDVVFGRLQKQGKYDAKKHQAIERGPITGSDGIYIGYSVKATAKNHTKNMEIRKDIDNAFYSMLKDGFIEKHWKKFVEREVNKPAAAAAK